MSTDENECPFCFEVIRALAIVCRDCGRDLPGGSAAAALPAAPAAPASVPNLESALATRIPDSEVSGLLMALVSRSLVSFDEASDCYRLLETVPKYARDRLL